MKLIIKFPSGKKVGGGGWREGGWKGGREGGRKEESVSGVIHVRGMQSVPMCLEKFSSYEP